MSTELLSQLRTAARILPWLPGYLRQRLAAEDGTGPFHLVIAIADHFEPPIARSDSSEWLSTWFCQYRSVRDGQRDDEGRPLRHTFFYPAERYSPWVIDAIQRECRCGWGELEIHLHHGIEHAASSDETRQTIADFRDRLAGHGCLSEWIRPAARRNGAAYGFVHGNWALANSAGGAFCGVDDEMQILADTGCYADFTLPAAPSRGQVSKVNALYECGLPLGVRAPHRSGVELQVGVDPTRFPLIIQGPLMLYFERGRLRLDNAAVTGPLPASLDRVQRWRRCGIRVKGRPDWAFIKLHCHGMNKMDQAALVGPSISDFTRELRTFCREQQWGLHFVTCREMVNIALAATRDENGNPGAYRDYALRLRTPSAVP